MQICRRKLVHLTWPICFHPLAFIHIYAYAYIYLWHFNLLSNTKFRTRPLNSARFPIPESHPNKNTPSLHIHVFHIHTTNTVYYKHVPESNFKFSVLLHAKFNRLHKENCMLGKNCSLKIEF